MQSKIAWILPPPHQQASQLLTRTFFSLRAPRRKVRPSAVLGMQRQFERELTTFTRALCEHQLMLQMPFQNKITNDQCHDADAYK
jgi:hypothetical protein